MNSPRSHISSLSISSRCPLLFLLSFLSLIYPPTFLRLSPHILLSEATAAKAFLRKEGKPAPWHHGPFETVRSPVDKSVRSILHSRTEMPLSIPLEVNVVLVGFSGDGAYRMHMDPEELKWLLQRSFPSHRPVHMDGVGGEGEAQESIIEHDLSYSILPVGGLELLGLEMEIKANMKRAEDRASEDGTTERVYDVEATKVEPVFDQLYSFLFDDEAKAREKENASNSSSDDTHAPSAIFLCNFDKIRMDPEKGADGDAMDVGRKEIPADEVEKQEGGYVYRYSYNGAGHSQIWLSHARYVVIDLSAGPTTFGQLGSAEGAVGSFSIPRVRSVYLPHTPSSSHSKPPPNSPPSPPSSSPPRGQSAEYFRGAVSRLLVSAVEHLLSPDVRFEAIDVTHRVLVAIIVLRNHHHFNPLHDAHPHHSIDVKAVEKQVRAMVAKEQHVVMVEGAHSLHDHPRLAMAVERSLRHSSHLLVSPDGSPHVKTRTTLDGSLLLEEFRNSADLLAAGLLEAAHPALASSFFNEDIPGLDADVEQRVEEGLLAGPPPPPRSQKRRTVMPVKTDWNAHLSLRERTKSASRRAVDAQLSKTHGTRVIPVFVLSLAGMEGELLMPDESQLFVAPDAAIVLQSMHNSSVPLSFVSEGKRVHGEGGRVQRWVVGGVASVLGGLVPPFHDVAIRRRTTLRSDWLWGVGHHPFGPFSNTPSVSALLLDTIKLNSIYAQIDVALSEVRLSLKAIDQFSSEFLQTSFGGSVIRPSRTASGPKQWLDRLYSDPKRLFHPIPHSVVERLMRNLEDFEGQLLKLSGHLYELELKDARTLAHSLLQFSLGFRKYVEMELGAARDEMKCCKARHRFPSRSNFGLLYAGILAVGFSIYFLVIFYASPDR